MNSPETIPNPAATPALDHRAWVRRWDDQQRGYLPDREGRFTAMFDALEVLLPASFRALDLGCGCGSLSARLLERFPESRVTAVDFDPVLLHLGRGAYDFGARLEWLEANLIEADWAQPLHGQTFDAVLSTTALHWLPQAALVRLYHDTASLLKPGRVLLNGDHFAFSAHEATFARVALTVKNQRQSGSWAAGTEDWAAWWQALRDEPTLRGLFAERDLRFNAPPQRYATAPSYALHEAALRDAGFLEVGTIWQNMDNRVLMGIRP